MQLLTTGHNLYVQHVNEQATEKQVKT